MKAKIINENGEATYALIFETAEEAVERFAREHNLNASRFNGRRWNLF